MPFPLAHPAAVLPLRRYCPGIFSFPALVIGSLSPDVGYLVGGEGTEEFSHSLLGSVLFCLPIGLLMFGVFRGLGPIGVARLPEVYQRLFLPVCNQPAASTRAVILSLFVGVWTHLFLDSFTHSRSWLVLHFPILQNPVGSVNGHTVKICHLLWYGSSFVGVAWLCLAYRRWQESLRVRVTAASRKSHWAEAVLVATLVVPIELAHHLVHGRLGAVLVTISSLALVLAVLARIAPASQNAGNGPDDVSLIPS